MFEYEKFEKKQKDKVSHTMQRKETERYTSSHHSASISDHRNQRCEYPPEYSFEDIRVHYHLDKPNQLRLLETQEKAPMDGTGNIVQCEKGKKKGKQKGKKKEETKETPSTFPVSATQSPDTEPPKEAEATFATKPPDKKSAKKVDSAPKSQDTEPPKKVEAISAPKSQDTEPPKKVEAISAPKSPDTELSKEVKGEPALQISDPVKAVKDMPLLDLTELLSSMKTEERKMLLPKYKGMVERISLEEVVSVAQRMMNTLKDNADLLNPFGKRLIAMQKLIDVFIEEMKNLGMPYIRPPKFLMALQSHELFGHSSIPLYPVERDQTKIEGSYRNFVHRPFLEIEFVGDVPYARCYLSMFAPAPVEPKQETVSTVTKSSEKAKVYKDITAGEDGVVIMQNAALMNLGNPTKALLWAEDYLLNAEHHPPKADRKTRKAPSPVVRSFLVPLSEAKMLLAKENSSIAPVDQDRGSGQFKSLSADSNFYGELLHPLSGSLASFFYGQSDFDQEPVKGQNKFDMGDLQEFVTGIRGELHDLAKNGVAAQYGRSKEKVEFSEAYMPFLEAYYYSVNNEQTGFTGATDSKSKPRSKDFIRRKPVEIDRAQFKKKVIPSIEKKLGSRDVQYLSSVLPRLNDFVKELSATADSEENKKIKRCNETEAEERIRQTDPTAKTQEEADSSLALDIANGFWAEEVQVFPAEMFVLRANAGGGDCLFYALAGVNLESDALLALRGAVAGIRRGMPEDDRIRQGNAHSMDQAVRQSPVLESVRRFMPIFDVPNAVLADMQAIPGVYGGTEEIGQWAQLNRQTVIAIHDYGGVVEYNPDGTQTNINRPLINADQIQRWNLSGTVVIYQAANHWQRVDNMR